MNLGLNRKIVLERFIIPAKINGSKIDLDGVEFPLVGFTGFGSDHERAGNKSVWVNGEILSPNFIGNDNCSCRSHIEGIVTDKDKVRLLEAVYNFPAHEGDCFEFELDIETGIQKPILNGRIIPRLARSVSLESIGQICLELDPYWARSDSGKSISPSLPWHNRPWIKGTYIPKFFETFLGEIEEQGYDHPYTAVSEKLNREREERKGRETMREMKLNTGLYPRGDLPF